MFRHRPLRIATASLATLILASVVHAGQARVDFGDPYSSLTSSSAGKYWNNVSNPLTGSTKLTDYLSGKSTAWSLDITRPFVGGWDTNGTTKPKGAAGSAFPASATRDSFDGYASVLAPQITLRNLPTTETFSFNIFASTMNGSANRSGLYTIRGATTASGTLNATNNTSNLLVLNSIRPAADGTIRIDINGGASNNSSFKQVFLNALTITSTKPVTPPTPAAGKNLLFFGNSFTALNDVPNLVGSVAVADGKTQPYVVGDTADSRGLEDQLLSIRETPVNNIRKLPSGKTWDYVVMQDYSNGPTHNGDIAGYRANAAAVYKEVKAGSPNVKPVLYETWAYRPTSADFYDPTPEDGQWTDADQMQAELRTNVKAAKADLDVLDGNSTLYAGVGDKWQQAGFANDLYDTYDDKHPSIRGSTLAALVLYSTIYKDNVSDIPFTKVESWATARGLTASDWTRLTGIADANSTLLTGASFEQIYAFAQVAAVPEPGSLATLIALGAIARRRR